MGHYAVMGKDYYNRVFKKNYKNNTDLYKIDKDVESIKDEFQNYKSVVSVVNMNSVQEIMNEYMNSIEKVQVIITVASALFSYDSPIQFDEYKYSGEIARDFNNKGIGILFV